MSDIKEELTEELPPPANAEAAPRALVTVQALLRRNEHAEILNHKQVQVEQLVHFEGVGTPTHQQHLHELQQLLDAQHPADIAYILEALPLDERRIVWDLVKAERDGEILLEVSDTVRETLIASMDREELLAAAEQLDADEIADLAPDLPRDVVEEVVSGLPLEEREQLRAAMSYPEDSVGASMDFDLIKIRNDISLEVVLRYLRRLEHLPGHTDQVFVVDRDNVLCGSLPINRLLVNEPEVLVEDVMRKEPLSFEPLDDISDAAQAFERYDMVSAPVVDASGKLVGRLTIDEIVDVIREESDEQVLSKAGLHEEDIFASVWSSARNRAPWLLVNLCTASIAAFVASRFEGTVSHIVILAFLMSIVAGIGGNSGNQTMTLIIRALALGQITVSNVSHLLRKELLVAFMIGAIGGAIAGAFAWSISGRFTLGLVMMAAMILNLLLGAAIGMLVPVMRARFGKDPALGSSVLLTFATDTMGFFIFLGLATLFLL